MPGALRQQEEHDAPDAAAVFERHRERLWAVAYGMLGSPEDAEDMVQEAYLRWGRSDREAVRSPEAWLVTTVGRLCTDRLRTRRAERNAYAGPWLPTPLVSVAPPPDRAAEVASELSLAFLLLLERLGPEERAAFLLHDVFGVGYPEIARVLERSEAACRQVVHRARTRVRGGRPRFQASPSEREALVERFAAAVRADDDAALAAILAPEVSLVTDGGGKAWAARRVVTGADRVARAVVGAARKRRRTGAVEERMARVNGEPGIVTYVDGVPVAATVLEVDGGRIAAVYRVLNPDKLRGIAPLERGEAVLETGRLRLRRLTPEDAAFIHALVNDPGWLRFIGDRGVRTLDDARRYLLEGPVAMYARLGFGLYGVEEGETGALAGICGLVKRDGLEDVDLGFAFLPEHRGRGYAHEAAAATLEHARRVLGLERIVAIVSPDNQASQRLLEKLGLRFERRMRLSEGADEVCLFAPPSA